MDSSGIKRGTKRYLDDSSEQTGNPSNLALFAVIVPLIAQIALLCVLIVFFAYYYSKEKSCLNNREVWCKDDWYCNRQTSLNDKLYNQCYQKRDHLASCLFGPNSAAATKCVDYSKIGAACPCVVSAGSNVAKGGSCLAGCPTSLSKSSKTTVCCCIPGTKGCANKILPAECQTE